MKKRLTNRVSSHRTPLAASYTFCIPGDGQTTLSFIRAAAIRDAQHHEKKSDSSFGRSNTTPALSNQLNGLRFWPCASSWSQTLAAGRFLGRILCVRLVRLFSFWPCASSSASSVCGSSHQSPSSVRLRAFCVRSRSHRADLPSSCVASRQHCKYPAKPSS